MHLDAFSEELSIPLFSTLGATMSVFRFEVTERHRERDSAKKAVISYLWKQRKLNAEMYMEMLSAFGDETPSKITISRWMEKFKDGCEDIADAPRAERPLTTTA